MSNAITFTKRVGSFAKGFASDPFTHWPFPVISRRVYGNLAGFRQNLFGSIDTTIHRLLGLFHKNPPCDAGTRKLAADLRKYGLAKANGWIEPATIATIRTRLVAAAETAGSNPSEYMTILEAHAFAEHAPEVFDIFNARVNGFLEHYFGGPFLVNSGAFRFTRHVPEHVLQEREVYSDRWHSDSGPTSMLAIFVLLNDLGPDGGPTSAINISATKDVVRQGYTSRKESGHLTAQIENDPTRVEMTGPAGTIMFVNVARCLHRAGIPTEGNHREWLQFRLFPCRDGTDTTRLRAAKILKYTNRIDQDY
ncbi:MAG: hypothetical protein HOK98_14740 [Rhodospirillaceae bacterium]|jgi:hypothetical protein|nr:hypothetical protein [Rhodospirillaceae bacterium]